MEFFSQFTSAMRRRYRDPALKIWTPGYHDWAVWRRGSLALMKPDGFDRAFKPRGRYFDLCAQGRLLILACRSPAAGPEPMTREPCLAMTRGDAYFEESYFDFLYGMIQYGDGTEPRGRASKALCQQPCSPLHL